MIITKLQKHLLLSDNSLLNAFKDFCKEYIYEIFSGQDFSDKTEITRLKLIEESLNKYTQNKLNIKTILFNIIDSLILTKDYQVKLNDDLLDNKFSSGYFYKYITYGNLNHLRSTIIDDSVSYSIKRLNQLFKMKGKTYEIWV